MGQHADRRARGLATIRGWLLAGTFVAGSVVGPLHAETAPSSRVALVIGIGGYATSPTPAAPNDAGLVAQTLQGAGFDVTAARDLDGEGMRRAFRDFLDKAAATGPDGVAVVYLAGRAVQADGDNFFVPADAKLARPADVPIETVRLGDFTHALAALPIEAKVVVVDAAYAGGPAGAAPGLALVDAEQGELIAFNAAPGSVAPATQGPYGPYAQAFVQGIKQGGVPVSEIFERLRLSVDQASGGAELPWESDKLTRSFTFFDRGPDAPAVASAQIPFATLAKRPIRDFPPDQAYDVAIARDTLPAYQDFLAAFPDDPLARRIRLIVSVRREALFWRASLAAGSPPAFWTYLERYPQGPHAADARRRLTRLAAAAGAPPNFRPLAFDVPPPPPGEIVVFDRPEIFVDAGLPPPPPPPVFLLPPPIVMVLPPPPPPRGPRFLPIPIPVAIPGVRPIMEPGAITPPRGIGGEYGRPRPYRRGPGGDGLVGENAPERVPPAGAAPPLPVPLPIAPDRLPPVSGRPVPPSAPAPQAPPPAVPPLAPRPPAGRPLAPGGGSAGVPVRPSAPIAPALPPAAPPVPTVPPPGLVAPPPVAPPARPGRSAKPHEGGVAPGRPAPSSPAAPDAAPIPTPATPPVTAPAAKSRPPRPALPDQPPGGDVPPRHPGRPRPGAVPPTAAPPDAAPPSRPLPSPGVPPRPQADPQSTPRPAPAPDGGPPSAGQPRPGPSRPEPGAERGRPPEGGRGAGGPRHPDCGHPGQPPCA